MFMAISCVMRIYDRSDDCYVLEQRAKSIRLRHLASYSTHAPAKRRYFQLAYEEDLY